MPPQQPEAASAVLVICDSNVVIMMAIFKASVMFDAQYSFGKVEVHSCVIEELESWIKRRGAKLRKFGEPLISIAIEKATKRSGHLKEPTDQEYQKNNSYLTAIETRLAADMKGTDTSRTDKDLVALARKNGACLATQELTLRSLAIRSLTEKRVLSFEEMVVDLFKQGKISAEEVRDGISTLEKMGENLRTEGRKLLNDAIKSEK